MNTIPVIEWLKRAARRLAGVGRGEKVESLPWTPVVSSCVAAVRYDGDLRTLYLRFTNNAIYCYFNVPAEKAIEMVASVSKGTFVWRELRGRFVTVRLQPPY